MIRGDFHLHTSFCDGKNTPEEMVRAALDMGMEAIGFSGHSRTGFDESWCMTKAGTAAYRREIARLKEKYAGQIAVFCGLERDYYADAADADPADYDYVIGSVHYLCINGSYLPVDESREILLEAADTWFHGDIYGLIEAYYRTVDRLCETPGCSVIGHFDLISKFNEDETLFDSKDPRYIAAWQGAADVLLRHQVPFEINTGAISRGYRTAPYPSAEIRQYLLDRGGRFLLSSDAHSAAHLCFQFECWSDQPGLVCPVIAPGGTLLFGTVR